MDTTPAGTAARADRTASDSAIGGGRGGPSVDTSPDATPDAADGTSGGSEHATAIRLRGITKTYGAVRANRAIDLDVRTGSVHGLLGENGAGKSTLMKTLFGIVRPDAGTIEIGGELRRFRSPRDALAAGIGMVQQHFSLVADFTVAENLVLGDEYRKRPGVLGLGVLDRGRAVREVQALADRYGFRLDASAKVGTLAVGARQRIEILKALRRGARILILDEPTAALAPQEVDELFGVVRRLVADGCTVVFISHKLAEVAEICDDVTVLRDGAVAGRCVVPVDVRLPGEARSRFEVQLAEMMVGRELPSLPPRPDVAGAPVLHLRGAGDDARLGPIELEVRGGEIVGVAGVEGNGQTELVELLLGVRDCARGSIELLGTDVSRWEVSRRLRAGIGHVAEDRHAAAVAEDLSLTDNCLLGYQDEAPFRRGPLLLSSKAARRLTTEVVRRQRVRTPSLRAAVADLSGGNQQKLVVGREMARRPKLMIAAQPTRGLDIAATAFVHEELLSLRNEGCAVLLVSLDLTEVLSLADRVVVMNGGRVAGAGRPDELDARTLGRWMTGEVEA